MAVIIVLCYDSLVFIFGYKSLVYNARELVVSKHNKYEISQRSEFWIFLNHLLVCR